LKKASNIKVEDISIQNKSCVVHLAPICDEFSVELIDSFHHNVFVAVTPQGWLRDVDSEHRISSKTMNWDYLEKADAVIISDEECPQDQLEFEKMKKAIRLLIVTKNESGTVAYVDGKHLYLPAFPVKPVNFSGAGDVFASVFFARYFHTKDLKNSLILANCAASLHVENIILAKEEQMRLLNQRVSRYNEIFAV
jgi:sugar/nucleoside kinase (ribokinase family)